MTERAPAPGGLALVQRLVNTVDLDTGEDSLDDEKVRRELGITADGTGQARELREALRAACLAHAGHPPHQPVRPLGELLAQAPLFIDVDGATGAAALHPADPDPLTSRIAAAIAQGVTDGSWLRLKACHAPDCHWAFYDRSPAGRGRWCVMSVCGSRSKMRAYRARRAGGVPD
ncbi:CGNR zinc finger domain-containing protein [Streptomyces triticagri]|uniref:CGNR zinc finger domain-containing protein n=1 Tax=Streptomyces triticagri TaxID=2293568 RepID=A0A372MAK3_9ACTN|nr:CGNR zinc finger domain-containing protein [Streptomyces triticagri]RFU87921.1 CGNR zinc finger domain-containing protein [Streptomyces triticagri]